MMLSSIFIVTAAAGVSSEIYDNRGVKLAGLGSEDLNAEKGITNHKDEISH